MKTKLQLRMLLVFSFLFLLALSIIPELPKIQNRILFLTGLEKPSYPVTDTHGEYLNVPASDGQLLFDIITKNGYKNAVEIGTSTGHSGVWIAGHFVETGGKLITMEIDEDRYKEALANFKEAGVADYIDARLCDAHEMVKQLKGPIDFVFSDADKDWYTNYLKELAPKLIVGGSFVSHNITQTRRQRGITEVC